MDSSIYRTLTIAILAGPLLLGGCGDRKQDPPAGRIAADTAAGADTASGAPGDAEVKIYTFHGTPTKIDSAKRVVVIDHEVIEGFMEPMTMPFEVADAGLVGRIAVGRRSLFTIRVAGWEMLITDVGEASAPADTIRGGDTVGK